LKKIASATRTVFFQECRKETTELSKPTPHLPPPKIIIIIIIINTMNILEICFLKPRKLLNIPQNFEMFVQRPNSRAGYVFCACVIILNWICGKKKNPCEIYVPFTRPREKDAKTVKQELNM